MRWFVGVAALALALGGCNPAQKAAVHPKRACAAPRAPHKFAVLVNADTASDHKRNIARAYQTLAGLGFAPKDVTILSPRDRRNPPSKGTALLRPTPDQFTQVIAQLATQVEPEDLVVIYGTGHGDSDHGLSVLELRQGDLAADEFREAVEQLRGRIVIVMDQCFSGGFVDAFEGTRSRVLVIATVDKDHMTYCGSFARAFWESLSHPERADRNHDGKTSIREAFDVAVKAHHEELDGDPELKATAACRSFNGFDDVVLQ